MPRRAPRPKTSTPSRPSRPRASSEPTPRALAPPPDLSPLVPAPNSLGRPFALTLKVREDILTVLKAGNFRSTAARMAGIGQSTLMAWLARGQQDRARGDHTPFSDLLDAVEKAEAAAETRCVALINAAASNNWFAAAWFLERKYPKRWGRKDQTEQQSASRPFRELTREELLEKRVQQAKKILEADFTVAPAPAPAPAPDPDPDPNSKPGT